MAEKKKRKKQKEKVKPDLSKSPASREKQNNPDEETPAGIPDINFKRVLGCG